MQIFFSEMGEVAYYSPSIIAIVNIEKVPFGCGLPAEKQDVDAITSCKEAWIFERKRVNCLVNHPFHHT
jgi:hypothetical protein